MAKTPAPIDVICPCCEAALRVDPSTGAVLHHKAKEKPKTFEDFSAAVQHQQGEATRREYAVYVMVAQHRETGDLYLYVGKTGDNKEGCNPVISRAGNHFSFNKVHSQMRNKFPSHPEHRRIVADVTSRHERDHLRSNRRRAIATWPRRRGSTRTFHFP